MTEPAGEAPEGEQRLSKVLKALTQVTSYVAFTTALLYYFGWRRSEAQAHAFGADASVFGMSSEDYVLRSIDVVLIPLLLLLLAGLGAAWLHGKLVGSRYVGLAARVLGFRSHVRVHRRWVTGRATLPDGDRSGACARQCW